MNVQLLIDSFVRQTMVLIAQVATTAGERAPLARVANQVFLDLAQELQRQGIGRKVIADMFGMALRSYQQKVQRLSESATDSGTFTLNRKMNGANEDPPSGVTVELKCWPDPAPDRSQTEEDGSLNGWSCEWDGCSDGDFYCHESADLCVAACQTDADCEANDLPSWWCWTDDSESDERFCVHPTTRQSGGCIVIE